MVGTLLGRLELLPDLPQPLANALVLRLFEHRHLGAPMLAPALNQIFGSCELGRRSLIEALLLEVMKSGEAYFCDVFAGRLQSRWSHGRLGDASLEASRALLLNAKMPALGRALAALALARFDRSLPHDEVAPLLRDPSSAVQLLALAAMRRARCLTEQDLLVVLSKQFKTRREKHEHDGLSVQELWMHELGAALADVASTATAKFLEQKTRGWDDGLFVSSSKLLQLFAERFPEESLPVIDDRLGQWFEQRRWQGVQALRVLPLELALPRLERACTDPVPLVSVTARDLLRDRATKVPAAGRESMLPQGLLDAPPSERLVGRLLVAGEPDVEARKKLRDALVAEAKAGRAGPEEAVEASASEQHPSAAGAAAHVVAGAPASFAVAGPATSRPALAALFANLAHPPLAATPVDKPPGT